ncbi:MAG TPA: phytanoyl-CoA dioxygenase family protein [Acidimicrobiia bacterium]|nr:phytanoyl-CoA dioxygenase family protein [Acidimicrobiia bacterium]
MALSRLAASAPPEQIVGALERDGAVIVDDLLDADVLARFNAEIDPFLEAAKPAKERPFINPAIQYFFGAQTRDVTGVAGRSRVFSTEILTHPVYKAVCDAILLPHCATYQLNIAHVLDRGPGSDDQFMHRDELVWVHLPKPHPEIQLASVIALVDFTADNGATRVVPGSHKWTDDRSPTPDEIEAAEMRAGSAIVYLGSTLHGGGANVTTGTFRRGMHVSYCVGWLRTEENQYLATPLDFVRTLPPESQALLGYAAHDAVHMGGGYLGTVAVRDPVELLAAGEL